MKIFDVHQHYDSINFCSNSIHDIRENSKEDFEDSLITICKKLDMVVAVNGLGIDVEKKVFYNANKRVEKFFKKYPQYIVGMAYVDMDNDNPDSIDEFNKKGFRGCKFYRPQKRYDDPSYWEFYRRCEYNNMVVLFHTGISGALSYWPVPKYGAYSDNMNPITLEAIGFEFPKLNVIGAHLGTGYYIIACKLARATTSYGRPKNIYFDISGGEEKFLRPIFEGKYIVKDIPISQTLFGLDLCPSKYEEVIDRFNKHFDDIKLCRDDRDRFFYKNACEIFGIKCN